ncbi:hypothetical protein ILUMI_16862 [Ignelater luminosus]|uniref:Metalloendopeptidase n=1 Tax=Ignelater luminosus TaxID=2038154 RepID=A0A8K0CPF6_IGNLU|nr:hypothetical protein ILUMI_16862 [Ignelater luminosus]
MYDEDEITDFGEKYDYDSLMHYSAYAFSRNGKMTIVPKFRLRQIGQRRELSAIDIRKIKKKYCSKDWTKLRNVKPTNETGTASPSADNKINDGKESRSNVQPENFKKRSKKRGHRHRYLWQ